MKSTSLKFAALAALAFAAGTSFAASHVGAPMTPVNKPAVSTPVISPGHAERVIATDKMLGVKPVVVVPNTVAPAKAKAHKGARGHKAHKAHKAHKGHKASHKAKRVAAAKVAKPAPLAAAVKPVSAPASAAK